MPPIKELEDRVSQLSAKFLDTQIPDETNANFVPDLDAIAAFRLLVHAAIEDWLEKKAREELAKLSNKVPLRSAHRLMMLSRVLEVDLPNLIPFDRNLVERAFAAVISAADTKITENNGIKHKGFGNLALICGCPPDEIDPALASMLDAYGRSRGDVAHKGLRAISTLNAPSAEKGDANSLVTGIRQFFSSMVAV